MFDDSKGFLSRAFLEREWALDYKAWRGGEEEAQLLARLRAWAGRADLRERSAVAAFLQTFFIETWGYEQSGRGGDYTACPEYPVPGAGAGGGSGSADLALGWFGEPRAVPQVLCEFKDIRSSLDAPQARKGNTRSPVRQCLDYVAGVRREVFPNEPIQAWWGLVSDMNEFRLYWWDRPQEHLRFVIRSPQPLLETSLIDDTEAGRFDRFVFVRLFSRGMLLSRGGRPALLRLVDKQGEREKALEGEFYADYKSVRERLFEGLRATNPAFAGTPGQLLRQAQKILDRFIFAFYCEDMGERMLFPPQLIRDHLIEQSLSRFFDPKRHNLWEDFTGLFAAMDTGGDFGAARVRMFNGGLFAADPQIDALRLPNSVFCQPGQGANAAAIRAHADTLLHLCGSYNFAARGAATESIGLYTLGRIFEQSITELEIREAELENRLSLAKEAKRKLPKRKRDGVYYTPEWVVNRLVEMTMAPWFKAARMACGWPDAERPADEAQLDAYAARVAALRVVDPACGSGAFLIGAFRRLLRERRDIEALRAELRPGAPEVGDAVLTAAILDRNLHGVDISGAAVEIAKLALWLHSARADAPLSSLDGAVVSGNSLVGPDFYAGHQHDGFDRRQREQVNAFDWGATFAFGGEDPGHFDIVLGNPPYVKLQNLRKVDPEVADYLSGPNGYASARTGNFDLYLPFIEKGLALLRTGGRMGYIAPSLWTVNEYGRGLRRCVREGANLETWVDFKSYQVFDEAITYTALQVFTAEPNAAVQVIPAPGGEADLSQSSAGRVAAALPYDRLPASDPWLMVTGEERALIDRLANACTALGDPENTKGIIVGIQSTINSIYQLKKLGDELYLCSPKDGNPDEGIPHTPPYNVKIENSIMKPLVSGPEAKRYENPSTSTYLLFPYVADRGGKLRLLTKSEMESSFPLAWEYLQTYQDRLIDAGSGKKDWSQRWWGYVYPKNLDRQQREKLIVAQTVPGMRVCLDASASLFLDNVRVNGILSRSSERLAFLLAALNSPVVDFVFQRTAKPKAGGYFEANKQFIAPLPIPRVDGSTQHAVGDAARELQHLHTNRRDLLTTATARLGVLHRAARGEAWLWSDLTPLKALEAKAPRRLALAREKRDWARRQAEAEVETRRAAFAADLARGGRLEVRFADGELRLLSGGGPILQRIYLDDDLGELIAAYWRWVLLSGGGARDAAALEKALRTTPTEPGTPGARQFIDRVARLTEADAAVERDERAMNAQLFDLYGLTPEERRLIEAA